MCLMYGDDHVMDVSYREWVMADLVECAIIRDERLLMFIQWKKGKLTTQYMDLPKEGQPDTFRRKFLPKMYNMTTNFATTTK